MKSIISIIIASLLVILTLSGCGQGGKVEKDTIKLEGGKVEKDNTKVIDGYTVNSEYDSESMKSITGKEYVARENKATLVNKQSGIGITMTEKILTEREKEKFKTGFFIMKEGVVMVYTTEKATSLIPTDEVLEKMSDDEQDKLWKEYNKNTFDLFAVVQEDPTDEESKTLIEDFKKKFSNVEKLFEFDGNTFYFAYNDDISKCDLTDEEKKELNGFIDDLDYVKDNICIFKAVKEEEFLTKDKEQSDVFAGTMTNFSANTIDGAELSQDVFKNYDITMVNVWSTWCGHCVKEIPEIQKLYESLPENVNIISICTDGHSEKELAKSILDDAGVKFQTIIGNENLEDTFYKYIDALPTTAFVDASGNIVGEVQVGVPGENVVDGYTNLINNALKLIGK